MCLRTYTGERIELVGKVIATVVYGKQKVRDMSLLVIKGTGPSLFGRDLLQTFDLKGKEDNLLNVAE